MNERVRLLIQRLEKMAANPCLDQLPPLLAEAATTLRSMSATVDGALHRNHQLEQVIQLANDTLTRHHHRLQSVMGSSTVPELVG